MTRNSSEHVALYEVSEFNMEAGGHWFLAAVISAENNAGILPRIRLVHDFDFPPHMSTHRTSWRILLVGVKKTCSRSYDCPSVGTATLPCLVKRVSRQWRLKANSVDFLAMSK